MLTFESFRGINNVIEAYRLAKNELRTALNVDIGRTGNVKRRKGYTEVSNVCHKNLWQASGFKLATCNSDLVHTDGVTQTVLLPSLGVDRVWYCNLPDGRTTFSNGLINGITDGTVGGTTTWGVPIPSSLGAFTDVSGNLHPGTYQYQLTHVRLADGLESGPSYAIPIEVEDGGVVLAGLPVLAGHKVNVYLSSHDGTLGYYAGSTSNGAFSFTGKNTDLVLPCRTDQLYPAPKGTVTAFWRGRVLVAVGPVLYASRHAQPELFDLQQDFKQFSAPITLIQPVDGGIFVGTEQELVFLSGTQFDALVYSSVMSGRVVLGSGVSINAGQLLRGDTLTSSESMVCICDGGLVAGYADGSVGRLTDGRYRTAAVEVAATFRVFNDIPQYVAIPQ